MIHLVLRLFLGDPACGRSVAHCPLLFLLLFPLLLTQCNTIGSGPKSVKYDAARLATIPGHGHQKKDYPFDDDGKYRVDWVRNNTTGRTRSSYNRPVETSPTTPASPAPGVMLASADVSGDPEKVEVSSPSSAGAHSSSPTAPTLVSSTTVTYPTPPTASASVPTVVASAPAPPPVAIPEATPPAPPSPQYHRVASGDTLFALSGRYGTSVDQLKRVNGLTGDAIRVGQSLRIP